MTRILMAALLAVAAFALMSESASAQHGRRGCRVVRGYTTPYYSYRSYGPGTHISRYAVPPPRQAVIRSSYYRVGPNYHRYPHYRYVTPTPYYNGYGYRRSGISLNIGF